MTTFKVEDMSCGHCSSAIEKAVHAVDPGADVACDLTAREVRIDSALSPDAIASAIRDAGYTPHVA